MRVVADLQGNPIRRPNYVVPSNRIDVLYCTGEPDIRYTNSAPRSNHNRIAKTNINLLNLATLECSAPFTFDYELFDGYEPSLVIDNAHRPYDLVILDIAADTNTKMLETVRRFIRI